MKSVREIGMKITAAQREYYRYTGVSAALERRGAGSSRPELAWSSECANRMRNRLPLPNPIPVPNRRTVERSSASILL
jgi:hypothetical protein